MAFLFDGRKDDYYNVDFMEEKDEAVIVGFDIARDTAKDMFYNLDEFDDDDLPQPLKDVLKENNGIITYCIGKWCEKERNEIIKNLIDTMPKRKFKRLRKKAMKLFPHKYKNTRHFDFTWKKVQ